MTLFFVISFKQDYLYFLRGLIIRSFKVQALDSIIKLWLETNISAHSFIKSDYWKSNFEAVKDMMPNATIYVAVCFNHDRIL